MLIIKFSVKFGKCIEGFTVTKLRIIREYKSSQNGEISVVLLMTVAANLNEADMP